MQCIAHHGQRYVKHCAREVQDGTPWNGKGLIGKTCLSLRAKRKLESKQLRAAPCTGEEV